MNLFSYAQRRGQNGVYTGIYTPRSRLALRHAILMTTVCVPLSVLALATGGLRAASAQSITGTGDISPTLPGPTGSWSPSGRLEVGATSTGALSVTDGATLNSIDSALGLAAGSNGSITISGQGSTWVNQGGILMNDVGTSSLTISDGARMETVNGSLAMGANSSLTITGPGTSVDLGTLTATDPSSWTSAAGYLSLNEGTATLSNGATLHDDGGYVGGEGATWATMTVTGQGTQWTNSLNVYVGGSGNGTVGYGRLTVSDGAVVSAHTAAVGTDTGSFGEMTLTGAGTRFETLSNAYFSGNMRVGFNGNGIVTVTDGAELLVSNQLDIGTNAGSTGTLNIGAAQGSAAAAAGTISATNGIYFGNGTATLVFNHTSDAYEFNQKLFGNGGDILQIAGTTIYTGDGSGFTGTTHVEGGTFVLNSTLGGTIDIGTGGTLKGSGSIGAIEIATGSTVAPGNSIGTLNTSGTYVQQAGALYEVELDPTSTASDLINAGGTATLQPGALISWSRGAAGTFVPGAQYTILTAAGGLTGTFDWSGSPAVSAFYDLVDSYDTNNAYLTVTQTTAFTDAALTPNQIATGTALEQLAGTNSLRAAVGMTADFNEAREAFDLVSGDVYASLRSQMLEHARVAGKAAFTRLADDGDGFWATAQGSRLALSGDGNSGAMAGNSFDMLAGMDRSLGDWRLGVMIFGATQHISAGDRDTTGTLNTGGLGAYAGADWGATALDLSASFGYSGIDTSRDVAIGSFSDHLSADYSGLSGQLSARLSQRISLSQFDLMPFGEAAYVAASTRDVRESGGLAALSVDGDTDHALIATIGTTVEKGLTLEDGRKADLKLGLGWQHTNADTPQSRNAFSTGNAFTVAGLDLPENALALNASAGVALSEKATLGVSYNGLLSGDGNAHSVKINLNGRF
jgi:outer membrane autotransporter protein